MNMQITMKRCITALLAALAVCLAFAIPQAWATDGDEGGAAENTTVTLSSASNGTAAAVKIHTNNAEVQVLQFDADIQLKSGNMEDFTPAFAISSSAPSSTMVNTNTTEDANHSTYRFSVYISNAGNFFKGLKDGDGLDIGTVYLQSKSRSTESAQANVTIPADAVSYAITGYTQPETSNPESQPVAINTTSQQGGGGGGYRPTGSSSSSSSAAEEGADDNNNGPLIIGETRDTRALRSMAETGDNMQFAMIALLGVAVVAVAVVAFMLVRRRKGVVNAGASSDVKTSESEKK